MLGPDAGGLSASTVARLTEVGADQHAHWLKRDLSARHYVYFWADGIHVQARLEDDAQCLLVIIGATPEGKKELVGLIEGVRESAQSWRELLLDLKRRGLAVAPDLAIADGALGFWKAIEEVWPRTRSQRCWVHKTANVLNSCPRASTLDLPRFGGHLISWEKGVHDADDTSTLFIRFPGADGRAGSIGPLAGGAGLGSSSLPLSRSVTGSARPTGTRAAHMTA